MIKVDLNGQWKMQEAGAADWLEVQVPGSVMNDLLQNGKIEDPFYRDNEKIGLEVAAKDFVYTRTFSVDEELLTQDKILLICEGLDTLAEVSVNGELVEKTNNMHRIYEIDVKSFVTKGENEISIKFNSPTKYIEVLQNEDPLAPLDGGDALPGFPYLRKAHYMFGWDWGPKIPDMGIWRNISIQAWSSVKLDDVYMTQVHKDNEVQLDVRVNVERLNEEQDLQLEVSLTNPAGQVEVKTVPVSALQEIITFNVDNPELWWPNGYGKQSLYQVEVSLLDKNGSKLDAKDYNIGLRTIEVKSVPDEFGRSFEFYVNGISIFGMGANYIPEDNILARNSVKKTERLLKDSVEANFNMVRIWGGGHYPEDYFYDLCDRLGLIVWQDFMFACASYKLTDEFLDTVKKEVTDNVKRLRHHASLGIWSGNNEVEEGWVHWGWPQDPMRKTDYIKLFEYIIPEMIKELDPQTFYWSSSPSSGGGFDQPRDPNRGDMHYWEVWHGLKPFTEYRKYFFRFCSEFGFQSFPSLKTVESFTIPEDRNIFSRVMEAHQKNSGANGKILFYLSENFLYPKDFDSLLYVSQLLQAEAIKYGVEHWRRNRGRCMGSLYWQLNDCWPVASWSSIDSFGRWKALHYFTKKFYAPILLSIEEEGKTASIHVTNDSLEDIQGRIEWKLCKNTSEVLKEGSVEAKVGKLSAENCIELIFEEDLSKDDMVNTYLEATFVMNGENHSNAVVLFVKPKHFEFLDPQITFDVQEENDQFILSVEANGGLAKYVELDLQKADCKFSDNYFDLSAGDTKKVTIMKDSLSVDVSLEELKSNLSVRSIYNTF
ncbi:beta-mannosidase [Lederbergia panacisoli]|uniref:beta-mannosidase n=1 Tax=Lederbergia panacisoli TaxID=1255251 RepID=UPI00214B3DD2|nr:glycoside hydrolase family 2 protein [Lederbergia panacisoli]MCR2823021.1 glycoside hydrolase family 2 protein [Lederbergia panacisoli]